MLDTDVLEERISRYLCDLCCISMTTVEMQRYDFRWYPLAWRNYDFYEPRTITRIKSIKVKDDAHFTLNTVDVGSVDQGTYFKVIELYDNSYLEIFGEWISPIRDSYVYSYNNSIVFLNASSALKYIHLYNYDNSEIIFRSAHWQNGKMHLWDNAYMDILPGGTSYKKKYLSNLIQKKIIP